MTPRTDELTDHRSPAAALRAAGVDVRPIPRARVDTADELRRVIHQDEGPVVVSGLTDGWPSRRAWTPDALRTSHGDRPVTALMDLPGTGVLYPKDQAEYERTLPLHEFLDAMATATRDAPCYLAYQRASALFDTDSLDFAALTPPGSSAGSDTRVWIGSAGTRSLLHSDLKDNLFCQFSGEKEVTLLPWRDSRAAYPFPDNLVNSQIDIGGPDLDRFPRLRRTTFHSSVVGPGDVVYIPKGCWHDIRSRTPSISVNHWFGKSQSLSQYCRLLALLGPAYWLATARDFVQHGLLRQEEKTLFFFSPSSTGKRLFDAVRTGNFSHDNDPAS